LYTSVFILTIKERPNH